MLLSVTPNPSIDRTLHVPILEAGKVHRATSVQLTAGGKGLNVSRAAHRLGVKVLSTGPLAGRTGQSVADLSKQDGLEADWYWLDHGETRNCLLLNHNTHDATVINEQGPTLSAEDWAGFVAHVKSVASSAQAVAFAGSLPLGVSPQSFGELARSLTTSNKAVYVDTSRAALQAVLQEPTYLCIKVNQMELMTGLGLDVTTLSTNTLLEAGVSVLGRGAAMVVVTLGSDGAIAFAPQGIWQATPPPIKAISAVGSGDSMLAGLIVARLNGLPIPYALAFGVACGSANATSDLPGHFERKQVEDVLGRVNVVSVDSVN